MADKRVKVAAVEGNLMFVLNGMEGGARSGWEWGGGHPETGHSIVLSADAGPCKLGQTMIGISDLL